MSLLLREIIFWSGALICVAAQLRIIVDAFRQPVIEGATRRTRPMELLWAFVPALALAVVLVLTWRAMHGVPLDSIAVADAAPRWAGALT